MASLKEIRARLLEQESKKGKNFNSGDNVVYAHWNIEEDSTAIIRFLEDSDTENPDFWVERAVFKFPFNGIKANAEHNIEATDKVTIVQLPCMEMYGAKDPVLDEVRTWFKDPSLEEMGRKYWKKRSYLYQGFVRQDPMDKKEELENPIRRFVISPQIHTLIKAGLMDPEMEELPTDTDRGLDFRIKKTQKGGYADYTTSTWARKETALTQEELEAIEKFGLFNLRDYLPARPDDAHLAIIKEMFEASVEGEAYDIEKFGKFYTPYGISRIGDASKTADKPAEKVTEKVTESTEKKEEVTPPATEETTLEDDVKTAEASIADDAGKDKAQDILAMIRSRQ